MPEEPAGARPTRGGAPLHVEVEGRLGPDDVMRVASLVEAATEADGVRPLSEHVVLHLKHGGDEPVRNVLAFRGERLVGYAHLDVTDEVEGSSAEVVVDPRARGGGVGKRLVEQLVELSPDGRLRLWAHGEHPGAAALARTMGFRQTRVLLQMRRSLLAALPAPRLPDGVDLRPFRPGTDDTAWVELNAKVFAGHPEQGEWTVGDLHRRMAEPWFDPEGFLVAERDGAMVGFHWTKVHGSDPAERAGLDAEQHGHAHAHGHPHGHAPIGEVYVLGVSPDEHRTGLGRALTLVGLRHLQARGLPAVMLYVEADNEPAIRLYSSLGFTRWDKDVMFRRGSRDGTIRA